MQVKDINRLAELAKIEVTEAETDRFIVDIESVLEYVKKIESLDLRAVSGRTDSINVMREDEVRASECEAKVLVSSSPDKEAGYIKVKKVLQ